MVTVSGRLSQSFVMIPMGLSHCSLWGHVEFVKAVVQGVVGQSVFGGCGADGHSDSEDGNPLGASSVVTLLGTCCPSYVAWHIARVVVDALNGMAVRWRFSDRITEHGERGGPCGIQRDAAAAVVRVVTCPRIQAAVFDALPDAIQPRFAAAVAVSRVLSPRVVRRQAVRRLFAASAGVGTPATQFTSASECLDSAVTETTHQQVMPAIDAGHFQNCQTSDTSPYLNGPALIHGVFERCSERGCFASILQRGAQAWA